MAQKKNDDGVPAGIITLVNSVCDIAGPRFMIDDARVELASAGVIEAVSRRHNGKIFEWLVDILSLQGISDAVAIGYIEEHERIAARSIERALHRKPSCPKLAAYHTFYDCGYRKLTDKCSEPKHKTACPVPKHDLRRGGLNVMVYSLWLYMRDVAQGDIVGWLDFQLRPSLADQLGPPGHLTGPIVGPLSHIFGVSAKTLNLAMATLLLAGDAQRPLWIVAGADMIAIDSLVHNWFCRTGILRRLGAEHAFGEPCYRETGCASLIRRMAEQIDARKYNRSYPKKFPRFIQYALWKFCAVDELNICNGRKINDRKGCSNGDCPIYGACDRLAIKRSLIGNPGSD